MFSYVLDAKPSIKPM